MSEDQLTAPTRTETNEAPTPIALGAAAAGVSSRLRIGLIAPPWFAVPPTGYGGIELVVSYLADGLAARGHDVTLFAPGGSRTTARLVQSFDEPPSALIGDAVVESRHLVEAYTRWREFDLIHDHTVLGLVTGATLPIPVVHTVHGPVTEALAALYARLARYVHFVAISAHQRSTLPVGLDATLIYNGIEAATVPFSERVGKYLLFVGRMNPEKGIVEALEIARRASLPLLVLAKINEAAEREYFETVVRPCLAGVDVDFREQVSPAEKFAAYRDAYATLFPIRWPEPFGLVMIESMATGTPVIALRNGSVPEVVEDGVTGFVCDSVDEAVAAVRRVATLDRRACRQRVERHFSADLNVARHEALYTDLVTQRGSTEAA